jgi:hypothetical protein
MKVLLVYPETPDTFWSYRHVLRIVSRKSAYPPLGLLTVAAMLPRQWELRLVDLNIEPLTDAQVRWADYVMLSAMLVHRTSVEAIVDRCAANARPVISAKRRTCSRSWSTTCRRARCARPTRRPAARISHASLRLVGTSSICRTT